MNRKSIVIGIMLFVILVMLSIIMALCYIKYQDSILIDELNDSVEVSEVQLKEAQQLEASYLTEIEELELIISTLEDGKDMTLEEHAEPQIEYIDKYREIDNLVMVKYFMMSALQGNVDGIEDFNRVMNYSYSREDFETISSYLRIIISTDDELVISINEDKIIVESIDGSILYEQQYNGQFIYGIQHFTFVDYGMTRLCEAINTSDSELLMNTFGEDGIDEIEVAEDVLNRVMQKFEGDVHYSFSGYDNKGNIYLYNITDGNNSIDMSVGIGGDGTIGYFILDNFE